MPRVSTPKCRSLTSIAHNYLRTQRDPFISARPNDSLEREVEIAGVASEELMRRFLEKLTVSIRNQLTVGGLSTNDRQQDAMALINGVAFRQGDRTRSKWTINCASWTS